MRTSIFLLVVMVTKVVSQNNSTVGPILPNCDHCPPSPRGSKGVKGEMGSPGEQGEPGDQGRVYYRGSPSQCGPGPCPPGVPGDKGEVGLPGEAGFAGVAGFVGPKGNSGDPGPPGRPGPSGVANGDVMYLPYKPGDDVGQVCYSFRKVCVVPGLRNGWRGWYREGQSGYMIYKKWMYFVTLSQCPCEYNKPSAPQPAKPRDCVRLGECQSLD